MVDRESEQRTETKQTPVVANNTGYINKQALLDEFEKWNFGKHGQLEKYFADRVFAIIDKVPTADVQEVRHGKWIGYPSITISQKRRTVQSIIYKCSCCGKSNGRAKSPYCKNCGSKMCGEGAEARFKELEDRK